MSSLGDGAAPTSVARGNPVGSGGRRTGLTYVGLMTAAAAIGFIKLLVYAKVLGATGFGYYGYVLLVLQFGLYASNWGILNGLNVELPMLYGNARGSPDRLARGALSALALTATATSLVYLVVVAAASPRDPNVETALLLAAALTLLSTLSEFYILILRARRRLVPLSITYVLRAALAVVMGAAAGALWGYRGVIGAELLALLLVIAVAIRIWVPDLLPARPVRSQVTGLIRAGIPLMLSNLVVAGSLTIDRIYVATSIPAQFGQYTFATIVVTASVAVSGMLNQAVAPQLLFERGGGLSLRGIRRRLLRISGAIVVAGGIGLGLLLLAAATLRGGLLSEYSTGLGAMPVLWVGGIASILAIYGTLLLAARRFVLTMVATFLGMVVALVGGWAVARSDPTVVGFAWVFTASQLVAAAAVAIASELVVIAEDRG